LRRSTPRWSLASDAGVRLLGFIDNITVLCSVILVMYFSWHRMTPGLRQEPTSAEELFLIELFLLLTGANLLPLICDGHWRHLSNFENLPCAVSVIRPLRLVLFSLSC
jgi:hypothetical protein